MSSPATLASWEPLSFDRGETRHWIFGPLDLWIRRTEHEWHVHAGRDPDNEERPFAVEEGEFPGDSEYRRIAAAKGESIITLAPVFPDRPVVARPELDLTVPPGAEALFFAGIPVWIAIRAGEKSGGSLVEEACLILSNTWLGAPTEGELCYALQTRASRDPAKMRTGAWRVTCPVFIKNKSEESLELQRICIRVKHLNIYEGAERLWSNQVNARYLSEEKTTEVDYVAKAPVYESGTKLLSKAREKPEKGGILARTFSSIRDIADFD